MPGPENPKGVITGITQHGKNQHGRVISGNVRRRNRKCHNLFKNPVASLSLTGNIRHGLPNLDLAV